MPSLTSLVHLNIAPDVIPPSLFPRKGGGGGGHGGGGGGGHGSSSGGKSSGGSKSSSSSSSKGSSGSAPGSSKFSFGSSTGASGRSATAYSNGGGKPFTLSSSSPFSGRQAGGGTRDQVYGTSQYGSGYPYGASGSYVDNRPFPYVFWPVPIAPHYYGCDPYAQYNGTVRPGGNMTTAIITRNNAQNTSEIYRLIGDEFSVQEVLNALVSNCTVKNTTLESFSPEVYAYPQPEQIIQWYRASTFGLGLDTYNNSAALASNMPSSNDTSPPPLSSATPLPAGLNMTFLTCLNTTIAASLPLMDPPEKHHLSSSTIVAIVGGSLVGALLVLYCLCGCLEGRSRSRYRESLAVPVVEKRSTEEKSKVSWLSRLSCKRPHTDEVSH